MSRAYVPRELRDRVAAAARNCCGYCLTSEAVVGAPMEIDHIIPRSLGGETTEANLWLACSLCNDCKSDRISYPDPLTGKEVQLFDPRRQAWSEHFVWTADGTMILGTSAIGRATVLALRLNRPVLVVARRAWVAVGWHPPSRADS